MSANAFMTDKFPVSSIISISLQKGSALAVPLGLLETIAQSIPGGVLNYEDRAAQAIGSMLRRLSGIVVTILHLIQRQIRISKYKVAISGISLASA